MAVRWAVATGNWSNTSTWNGGTLPSGGDDVYANTYTVTIDQDINVGCISTSGVTGSALPSGSFNCSTTRTLNCNVNAGATACLVLTSNNITLNGNIKGGYATNARGVYVSASNINYHISGNINGGIAINSYGCYFFNTSGTGNIIGNLTGGSASTSHGLICDQTRINISGNVFGGTGSSANGCLIGSPFNVYGVVSGNLATGLEINSATSGTVDGLVFGGRASNINGVYLSGANSSLFVNGNISGGNNSNFTYGVRLQGSPSTLYLNGNGKFSVFAIPIQPIQITSSAGTVYLNGSLETMSGVFPIRMGSVEYKLFMSPTSIFRASNSIDGALEDFTVNTGSSGSRSNVRLIGKGGLVS